MHLHGRAAGLCRELPNWMFDESYCAGMSLGPPQVSIEALNELCAAVASAAAESESAVHDRVLQKRRRAIRAKRRNKIEDNSPWIWNARSPTRWWRTGTRRD